MPRACRYLAGAFRTVFVATTALLVSCEKPALKVVEAPPGLPPVVPEPTFPIRRMLTSQEGKAVDSTIVGRGNNQLFIIRKVDGLKASVPFEKLAPADQAFALGLPIQAPPDNFLKTASEPMAEKKEAEDPNVAYVRSREKEIERLIDINLDLGSLMNTTTNQVELRSHQSSVERNDKEIERLKSDINRVRLK